MATKVKNPAAASKPVVKKRRQPAYKYVSHEGELGGIVSDGCSLLEELKDELEQWRDGMEEKLSHTEKYSQLEDCVSALESVTEPDVPNVIAEMQVKYSESVPTRKSRGPSRAVRLSNAVSMLQFAADAAQCWVDDDANKNHDDHGDVEELINELEDIINEVEGIDIPGMYS